MQSRWAFRVTRRWTSRISTATVTWTSSRGTSRSTGPRSPGSRSGSTSRSSYGSPAKAGRLTDGRETLRGDDLRPLASAAEIQRDLTRIRSGLPGDAVLRVDDRDE